MYVPATVLLLSELLFDALVLFLIYFRTSLSFRVSTLDVTRLMLRSLGLGGRRKGRGKGKEGRESAK